MSVEVLTSDNALFGHTDESSAYVVDDYPYGFRLRTTIRYWLETDRKHGDRFVSQTLNPKTGRWNKPKKSTYVLAGAMYLDDQDHVAWTGLSHWSKPELVEHFLSVTRPHLSDAQIAQVALIKGVQRAYEGVTFTIHEGKFTEDDKKKQAAIQDHINRRVAVETSKATFELVLNDE